MSAVQPHADSGTEIVPGPLWANTGSRGRQIGIHRHRYAEGGAVRAATR